MNDSQRAELESILNAAASRPRPALKYSEMSVDEFVFVWTYLRAVEEFSVLLVATGVCRNRGVQISETELTEIINTAEPLLTRPSLLKLAEWYYEPSIFLILGECMGEQPYVIEEINNRRTDRQIGTHLAVLPATVGPDADTSAVGKLLWRDRRIKALLNPFPVRDPEGLRESEYETGDLRQKAFLKALELIEGESKIDPAPLPPYPLSLRPDIQRIWAACVGEVWRWDIETNWGKIRAGFSLTDAFILEKVRDDLKTLWRRDDRHKAISKKITTDTTSEATLLISNSEEYLERRRDLREAQVEIPRTYEIAIKRSGKKGRMFLDGLKAGKTVTDAARDAGINRRTGERIVEVIRKLPRAKTHEKPKR